MRCMGSYLFLALSLCGISLILLQATDHNPLTTTFRYNGVLRLTTRVLVLVISAPANLAERSAVRRTWASRSQFQLVPQSSAADGGGASACFNGHCWVGVRDVQYSFKFIIGSTDAFTEQKIQVESQQFNDIIRGDFHESYYNLTRKTEFLINYAAASLVKAVPEATDVDESQLNDDSAFHFLVKADDDTYLNMLLVSKLLSSMPSNSVYGGKCAEFNKPKRNVSSKFYLSHFEYPRKYFPPYCEGPFYYLSADLVLRMPEVFPYIDTSPLYRFEDVSIGEVVRKLGVRPAYALPRSMFRYDHSGIFVKSDCSDVSSDATLAFHTVSPRTMMTLHTCF